MSNYDHWRIAYAKQGLADLKARERLLAMPGMPQCQSLHFLQMACEKICKAHLCGQGVNPDTLRCSHAYISGPLPIIACQQFARISGSRGTHPHAVMPALRTLASKIELLAPAVNQGGSVPANCEYPWKGPGGVVHAPCDHNFQMDLLYGRAGLILLKMLYTAAQDLIARY